MWPPVCCQPLPSPGATFTKYGRFFLPPVFGTQATAQERSFPDAEVSPAPLPSPCSFPAASQWAWPCTHQDRSKFHPLNSLESLDPPPASSAAGTSLTLHPTAPQKQWLLGFWGTRKPGRRVPDAGTPWHHCWMVAGGGALAARWNGARSLGIAGREPAWHAGSDGHQEVFGTQELMGIQVSTWSQNSKRTRSQEVSRTQRAPQR